MYQSRNFVISYSDGVIYNAESSMNVMDYAIRTMWSRNIRLGQIALAFSFSFQQSSRVTVNQKIVYDRNIKAPSGCVR